MKDDPFHQLTNAQSQKEDDSINKEMAAGYQRVADALAKLSIPIAR